MSNEAKRPPMRPLGYYLLVSVWFGVVAGLLEVLVICCEGAFLRPIMHVSRDFVWMAPLATTGLALLPGLVLMFVAAVMRRDWMIQLIFVGALLVTLVGILYLPGLSHVAALILAAGVAASFSRLIANRVDSFLGFARRTVGWLVALIVVLGVGGRLWRASAEARALSNLPEPSVQAPNVLIITLDTLRAANMSLYGYHRPTTPRLDEFAKTGAVFNWAMPAGPWTLPSHASMFTGRWYHELSTDYAVPLDSTYPTLAEVFQRRGYATAGFVANMRFCGYESGLDRGFIDYCDYPVTVGQVLASSKLSRTIFDNFRLRYLIKNDEHLNRKRAGDINVEFLNWLAKRKARPFFAFLNYFDVHEPYLPPAPFDKRFGAGRARGRHSPLHHWLWNPAVRHAEMSDATVEEERAAYDSAIAYLDGQLGALFDELARQDLLDNTLVVVTSDHGEEFGEHKVFDHGNSLYLPSVHVPLVIALPGTIPAGKRIGTVISLRDLPATITDLLDVPEGTDFPGKSLARYWNAPAEFNQDQSPLLCEVNHATGHPDWFPVSRGDMKSIVLNGMRYIKNGDGRAELYDMQNDYWEKNDLAGNPEYQNMLEQCEQYLQELLMRKDGTDK